MPKLKTSDFRTGDIIITNKTIAVSHCGIIVAKDEVAHAARSGMIQESIVGWATLSDVYRPRNLEAGMGARIEAVVKRFVNENTKTEYGKVRGWLGSWSGSSDFGNDAKQRLITYRLRLTLKGEHAIAKNVFCSEFVVLCYQLACEDENKRHFIKLDAKHTLPKNLRAYLDADKTYWGESRRVEQLERDSFKLKR